MAATLAEVRGQSRGPRDPDLFDGERVLVRRIVGHTLICSFTDSDYVTSQLLQIVKPLGSVSARYLAGLLNSRAIAYYFRKRYNRRDKTFPEIRIYELRALPIRPIDFGNPADVALHDKMVQLVDRMLELNKKKAAEKNPDLLRQVETQLALTDRQIDVLVYQLYGLTPEEIAIVEGNAT